MLSSPPSDRLTPAELVAVARPGVVLHPRPSYDGELVLAGGGEVFRLPTTPAALARQAVLVRALPALRPLLPVAVAVPRRVGVLADGQTPFTAEARLPGVPVTVLTGIAAGQWDGVVAALAAVSDGQAAEWGGRAAPRTLLHDPVRSVLTGLVDWVLADGAHNGLTAVPLG